MNISDFTTNQSALSAFKAHITFDHSRHILANNWSSATSICDWIGVSCGKRHRRVLALNLPHMGIGSIIPPHIGNLSFLSYFNISNTFHGHLPSEMTSKSTASMGEFRYGLETYPSFSTCFSQTTVSRVGFHLLLGTYQALESINLRYNFLEGRVLEEIDYLSKLQQLRMGFNHFSGSILPTIFNMSSLQWIDFTSTMMSGSLPDDICLSWNEFDGQIPSTMGECRELQIIPLSFAVANLAKPNIMPNLTQDLALPNFGSRFGKPLECAFYDAITKNGFGSRIWYTIGFDNMQYEAHVALKTIHLRN